MIIYRYVVMCPLTPLQKALYSYCVALPDFDNLRYGQRNCPCKQEGACVRACLLMIKCFFSFHWQSTNFRDMACYISISLYLCIVFISASVEWCIGKPFLIFLSSYLLLSHIFYSITSQYRTHIPTILIYLPLFLLNI